MGRQTPRGFPPGAVPRSHPPMVTLARAQLRTGVDHLHRLLRFHATRVPSQIAPGGERFRRHGHLNLIGRLNGSALRGENPPRQPWLGNVDTERVQPIFGADDRGGVACAFIPNRAQGSRPAEEQQNECSEKAARKRKCAREGEREVHRAMGSGQPRATVVRRGRADKLKGKRENAAAAGQCEGGWGFLTRRGVGRAGKTGLGMGGRPR